MKLSDWYQPPTAAEVLKEMQSHIPHDDDEDPDREDLKLRQHQQRYQRFRLKD